MSFTHMGAGMASPDSSSSQMYRRGVLIHCPSEFSVDIVPPVREGSSWHYGLRVKPLLNTATLPSAPPAGKRVKAYEIHRKWEDCLDLQRLLEKEYAALVKARKGKQGKKGNSLYSHPRRAASFDSLPVGPDPKTIPTDIHAFIPRLAAKSSLFRGASGSALVQQRSAEFNEFISALFAPRVPALIDEARQAQGVRAWFGFWRRDRDAIRRRDSERASAGPSTRRLSTSPSEAPPLSTRNHDTTTSPFTSSPLAQTSYESTSIDLDNQLPRPSHEITCGDLASALDTFPMPPLPRDGPVPLKTHPLKSLPPVPTFGNSFVPIVQRRLGFSRGDSARNASFRNAQFFSSSPPPLPPLPVSIAPSDDYGYDSEAQQLRALRRPQAPLHADRNGPRTRNGRSRPGTAPSISSTSTTFTHQSPPSPSPRSSQTSEWSTSLGSGVVRSLAGSVASTKSSRERDTAVPRAEDQNEFECMRKMSLSSLPPSSSKRPPTLPPRSGFRRSSLHHSHKESDTTVVAHSKPMPPVPGEVPTVVYDQEEPEFEIVTHTVLNSYLHDARLSLLSSEYAISSNSGSSARRSISPSIVSAYSASSGGHSVSSAAPQPPPPVPTTTLAVPAPALGPTACTPIGAPTSTSNPANEIILKAVCPIGDSIVICRVPRAGPLAMVRSTLATKFRQAAGVRLDLVDRGFVLGYLSEQPRLVRPGTASGRPGTTGGKPGMAGGRPGTAGGRPGTAWGFSGTTGGCATGMSMCPSTPARSNGRPGTAPGGRTRSSSLSSVTACADPTHLTLIVTQRDWENAVSNHGEKMTVRVLLAGAD